MTVIINENHKAVLPLGNILGSRGEHLLRKLKVTHPKFQGASYIVKFVTPSGYCYEAPVTEGEIPIDGAITNEEGEVKMQFYAIVPSTGESDSIFKSEIFTGKILPSIDNEGSAIPTYKQSKDMLAKLLRMIDTRPMAAETVRILNAGGSPIIGKANDN